MQRDPAVSCFTQSFGAFGTGMPGQLPPPGREECVCVCVSERRGRENPWVGGCGCRCGRVWVQVCVESASKPRGNTFKGLADFFLVRIWPWLSYMCNVRSTAVPPRLKTTPGPQGA